MSFGGAKEPDESRLFKVLVRRDGHADFLPLHNHEAGTIDKTEVLVAPGKQIIPACGLVRLVHVEDSIQLADRMRSRIIFALN